MPDDQRIETLLRKRRHRVLELDWYVMVIPLLVEQGEQVGIFNRTAY